MKILLIILLLFSQNSLFCQTDDDTVFAPFVSRLKASSQGLNIILTWKNSNDVQGKKYIYRHDIEITDISFKDAELIATVSESVESYIDTPEAVDKSYYYAVLIQDKSGLLYQIFIPYRNKTISGTAISLVLSEDENAAVVTDLKARVENNKVILEFASSKKDRELLLYRSTQPILTASDILKASFYQTLSSNKTSHVDIPIAGVDYYYAIMDTALVKSGEINFIAGQNTLKAPVQVPLSSSTIGIPKAFKRAFPLPALNLLYGVESGVELEMPIPFYLPPMHDLENKTESSIKFLVSEMESFAEEEITIQILSADKNENAFGEAYTLQSIVNNYLSLRKYPESELKLKDFLQTRHEEDVEARAHFYLAQTYYFQAMYKEAFLEFLLAEDRYYTDVQPWLNVCFKKIHILLQKK
jgi:hypothetical protein